MLVNYVCRHSKCEACVWERFKRYNGIYKYMYYGQLKVL